MVNAAESQRQTLYGAFWAENYAFRDKKSTFNHLFVLKLELWIDTERK